MRKVLVAIIALGGASPALAQQMNAEDFYSRAIQLKSKGPLAIFSRGEIRALTREGQASGAAAAAQLHADKAAGRHLRFCPPPGPRKMGSDEFIKGLAAIPRADRRRINMTEATTRIMEKKFPCRA